MTHGHVHVTAKRPQIADLDTLPMIDRGLIDYRRYHEFIGQSGIRNCITIQGSRGCPYRCFYCDVIKLTPRLNRRSAENVFDEIRHLHAMGVRHIEFVDDIFNVNRKDFIAFFRMIAEHELGMNFYFQSGLRGDILDQEAIDTMVAGGVKSVNLSLESASPRLQKMMKKNLHIDRLHRNLHYIVANHPRLILGLNAMHGFPTETEAEARATVDFIKDIRWVHFAQLHNVRIFPGSEIEKIALEHGVSQAQIDESLTLPYNMIPTTSPFDPEFSRKVRLDFVRSYVLNRDRLRTVLQHQLEVCSENEILFKYKSYFPTQVETIDDILALARLKRTDLDFSRQPQEEGGDIRYPTGERTKKALRLPDERPLRLLYLDATQFFSSDERAELRIVEAPLGMLALLTYMNERFGDRIDGRIMKSFVDYDSFEELQQKIEDFNPDLIGIRTMSYYKDFFRDTVAAIRKSNPRVPIIAGGPHPTSAYEEVLRETDIQAVVIGEGEITNAEILDAMLEDNMRFPAGDRLYGIAGLACPAPAGIAIPGGDSCRSAPARAKIFPVLELA